MDSLIKSLTSDKGIAILVEGLVFLIMGGIIVAIAAKVIDVFTDPDRNNRDWK